MDFANIPPPPPEEFEESPPGTYSSPNFQGSMNIPLPPGTDSSQSHLNYGNAFSQQSSQPRTEWQKAMEALNQSNASAKPSYGTNAMYGAPPPPAFSVPAPAWPPNAYSYPSYPSAYSSGPVGGQYGGAPSHTTGTYQRFASPAASYYSQPPQPTSSSAQVSNPVPPATQQNFGIATGSVPSSSRITLVARTVRQVRPKFSPYSLASSSNSVSSSQISQSFSKQDPATPNPPPTHNSEQSSEDMQLDDSVDAVRSPSKIFMRQAPEAGGVRFSLPNKKNAVGIKVPSDSLQKQPLLFTLSNKPKLISSLDTNQSKLAKSQETSVNSSDWPPSLQNYVTRAIQRTPSEKHEQVMQVITQMISNAYKTKTLFTVKWEDAPLPYADETSNDLFGLSPSRDKDDSSTASGSSRRTTNGISKKKQKSGKKSRVSRFSSIFDSDEDSPDKEFPLKNKSPQKMAAVGKSPQTLKGKLMGFGAEAPQTAADLEKLRRRQERFGDVNATPSPAKTKKKQAKPGAVALKPRNQVGNRSLSALRTVVGTCTIIEKEYFRLTDAVDSSLVRPVHILEQSLAMVIDKWKKEKDYRYTESQLKSIRQDLRVQHIFSSFTVKVYETHARIALEVGDQAEFTQCLSQLEWLYETLMNLERTRKTGRNENAGKGPVNGCENRREFLSYRILWVMRQNRATDATRVRSKLSEEDKKDTCIAFAFSVLSAYFAGDYQQFFALYKIAPMMSSYVMDTVIPQFRQKVLLKLAIAYRPNYPVSALRGVLYFKNDQELREFLNRYKLVFVWNEKEQEIDMKNSLPAIKAGPETAVPASPKTPKPAAQAKRPGRSRLAVTK